MTEITYKYSEDKILDEVQKYVESTYNSHYSKSKKYQSIDGIFASGNGRGFCIGNIQKYADRLYSKGTVHDARLDLIKIIHYAILAIHDHDQLYSANAVKFNPQSPPPAAPPGLPLSPSDWPPQQGPWVMPQGPWATPAQTPPRVQPNPLGFNPPGGFRSGTIDPNFWLQNGSASSTTGAANPVNGAGVLLETSPVSDTVNYSNTVLTHEPPIWRSINRWDDGDVQHYVVED